MQLEVIHQPAQGSPRPTPLLFVHGAWHGAWCWQEFFLPYFARHGYASYALSLRGHGASPGRERLRWWRVSEYTADLAEVAATLPAPPVVIGHSLGGHVVQKYLETHRAPGAVLFASLPTSGALGAALRTFARHPLAFLKANLTLSLYPLVGTPALARDMLFSADLPAERFDRYFPQLQDESYLGFLDMIFLNLPRPDRVTTPVLVLGAGRDRVFTRSEVIRTARAYHTDPHIYSDLAHDMMLETGWQAPADRILAWLDERKI